MRSRGGGNSIQLHFAFAFTWRKNYYHPRSFKKLMIFDTNVLVCSNINYWNSYIDMRIVHSSMYRFSSLIFVSAYYQLITQVKHAFKLIKVPIFFFIKCILLLIMFSFQCVRACVLRDCQVQPLLLSGIELAVTNH